MFYANTNLVLQKTGNMNRIFTTLVATLLIYNITLGQSAKEIAKNCLPSTVSLVMEDNFKQPLSLGSGFIIENGKIVTNLHVIEGAKYGYVLVNGSSTKHKIQGYHSIDKQNDLAILSIPTITGKSLLLTSSNPEIGEKIYAIGNPKGLSGTISEGIVSGIRDLKNKELIQITAPISPGSSGGPVINNSGQVIGVAVGTLTSGQNLNFAIPSSILMSLIAKENNSVTSLNIKKGAAEPKTKKTEIDIKEGVIVRNIKYKTKYDWERGYPDENGYCLKSFSILNRLPHAVRINSVIFILYDKAGIPIAYKEYRNSDFHFSEIFPSVHNIKSFLATTVNISEHSAWTDCETNPVLSKNNGEYLEIRILDFEIIEQ